MGYFTPRNTPFLSKWVISPQYTPFLSRWNIPLILTIDPKFQRDIHPHWTHPSSQAAFHPRVGGTRSSCRCREGGASSPRKIHTFSKKAGFIGISWKSTTIKKMVVPFGWWSTPTKIMLVRKPTYKKWWLDFQGILISWFIVIPTELGKKNRRLIVSHRGYFLN